MRESKQFHQTLTTLSSLSSTVMPRLLVTHLGIRALVLPLCSFRTRLFALFATFNCYLILFCFQILFETKKEKKFVQHTLFLQLQAYIYIALFCKLTSTYIHIHTYVCMQCNSVAAPPAVCNNGGNPTSLFPLPEEEIVFAS